jgi:hypothetical protein
MLPSFLSRHYVCVAGPEPWLSELSELSDKLSDCRTLSDSCQR